MKNSTGDPSSFKDPAARVYSLPEEPDSIFRELHPDYLIHYNHFISSGLSQALLGKKRIVPFAEFTNDSSRKVLKAERIPFVSFPYEWSFSQWKEAALLTLKIQFQALKFGMVLKDATPFNIVFQGSDPLWVDLSSFEIYHEGTPWKAYKQFCECFYLPLLLVKYFDDWGNAVFLKNFSGLPLSKGLALLPLRAFLNVHTLYSLALPSGIASSKTALRNTSSFLAKKRSSQIVEQIFSNISKLSLSDKKTKWNAYYVNDTGTAYLNEKEKIISNWLEHNYTGYTLIDFGCNTGKFSILLHGRFKKVIALDADIRAVDIFYNECRKNKIENIYCLHGDMAQPTPAVGWNNLEYTSVNSRMPRGVGLALALVHHLAISNYINFQMMVEFFATTCEELIIEFVPKEDDKVKLLLAHREDIFDWYNQENFEKAFQKRYYPECKHVFKNGRVIFHFILRP